MNEKTKKILIYGGAGVVVLGGGIYLYYHYKNTTSAATTPSSTTTTAMTTTGVPTFDYNYMASGLTTNSIGYNYMGAQETPAVASQQFTSSTTSSILTTEANAVSGAVSNPTALVAALPALTAPIAGQLNQPLITLINQEVPPQNLAWL